MAFIEKFLGRQVEIPEDRCYDTRQGLWAKRTEDGILFGLTQPALVLAGGIKDIDRLVDEKQTVKKGETLLFAITARIMYIESPIAGAVSFNNSVMETTSLISNDPYGQGWLFRIQSEDDIGTCQTLRSHMEYLDTLRYSEGLKNPKGLKGGVSGICKAVYSGIGEQKI